MYGSLIAAGIISLSLQTAPPPLRAEPEQPLNVLLITSDDLGPDLGSYGASYVETPQLDRLADAGVRFEVAYATQASCSPSRSSILTGRYPHSTGQLGLVGTGTELDQDLYDANLPADLKGAGYRTGIIGKLHVIPESVFPWDYWPDSVRGGVLRDVSAVAEAAERFITADQRPFFLMVNYRDPHTAGDDECDSCDFPPQVEGIPKIPLRPDQGIVLGFQGIDDSEQIERTANYLNSVMRVDYGVGLILDVLEANDLTAQTLVVFLGDHGPPFARAKGTAYEAGLRIPFLVRWPGVSGQFASPALVSAVDILPTILDAAGIDIPRGLDGASLRPVLASPDAPWRNYLFGEFHLHGTGSFSPRRTVRTERFQLIHNLLPGSEGDYITRIDGDRAYRLSRQSRYDDTWIREVFDRLRTPPEFELYDLSSDPYELRNLAGLPAYADVQADLTDALNDWRVATEDPLLDPATVARMQEQFRSRLAPGMILAIAFGSVATILIVWRVIRARRATSGKRD